MKKKILNRLTMKGACLFIALTFCMSCDASPKTKMDAKLFFYSQKEDGYGKVMKDSVASIMFNAKSITCELQSKNPADSLRQDSVVIVPEKIQPIVQFLFFNKNNFQSSETVYGIFNSWACYKFEARKKQTVYLELDFSLKKWRLLDANKRLICTQDMKENNLQLLHFTRLLFPQDLTLKLLNDNFKTSRK